MNCILGVVLEIAANDLIPQRVVASLKIKGDGRTRKCVIEKQQAGALAGSSGLATNVNNILRTQTISSAHSAKENVGKRQKLYLLQMRPVVIPVNFNYGISGGVCHRIKGHVGKR